MASDEFRERHHQPLGHLSSLELYPEMALLGKCQSRNNVPVVPEWKAGGLQDYALFLESGNVFPTVAQFHQRFLCVLAEFRGGGSD